MVRRKQSRLRVEQLEDRCLPSAAFVFQWNDLLLDVQRVPRQGNPQSARALAIMGAAVYDSVNAIDPTHEVFHVDARAFPEVTTASADAAAAQAAHDVAYALYTQPAERMRFDGCSRPNWPRSPTARPRTPASPWGSTSPRRCWPGGRTTARATRSPYTPGTDPGDWQPTRAQPDPAAGGTAGAPGLHPAVALRHPVRADRRRPVPPRPAPALTDADYTEAYREVKALGGNGTTTPTTRTPEQTEIAYFWAGLGVSNAGVAIWNQITQTVAAAHDLSLAENARLFAQVNVANADAFIASFDAKYAYNYWRPVTAIRAADTDGNPDTVPDPTWTPLIATPNHPSYGSNHSAQSRAAAEALAAFFGTDHVELHGDVGRGRRDRSTSSRTRRRRPARAGSTPASTGASTRPPASAGPEGRPVRRGPLLPAPDGCGWRVARGWPSPPAGRRRRHAGPARGRRPHRRPGGRTPGQAAGGITRPDDDAAAWGRFADATPLADSGFTTPGDRGEPGRMDRPTAPVHVVGHPTRPRPPGGGRHDRDRGRRHPAGSGSRRGHGPIR